MTVEKLVALLKDMPKDAKVKIIYDVIDIGHDEKTNSVYLLEDSE